MSVQAVGQPEQYGQLILPPLQNVLILFKTSLFLASHWGIFYNLNGPRPFPKIRGNPTNLKQGEVLTVFCNFEEKW